LERLLRETQIRPGDTWTAGHAVEITRRLLAVRYLASVNPPIATERPDGSVDVVIQVEEARVLGKVSFTGNNAFRRESLLAAAGLETGEPLGDPTLQDAVDGILELCHRDGFLLASVDTEITPTIRNHADVTFSVFEGRRVAIGDIQIEGASELSKSEALSALRLQPKQLFGLVSKGYYVPEDIEDGLYRLRELYKSHGYLSAVVSFDGIEFNKKKTGVTVAIRVREGPRYRLTAVRIERKKLFPTKLLEREAAVRTGGFYSSAAVEEGRYRLVRWYEERADVAPRIQIVLHAGLDNDVTVIYKILEEKHYKTGTVTIEGNQVTRDRVARREVTVVPGKPLTGMELERSTNNLLESGFYESVEPSYKPGSQADVQDLTFSVKEKERMGLFQVGGGASSGAGGVGYISLHHPNFDLFHLPRRWNDWRGAFVGGGQEIDIEVIPGNRESIYRARFVEPYFFRSDLELSLGGGPELYDRESYDEDRLRGSIRLRKFFDRDHRLSASLAYVADLVRINHLDATAPLDVVAAEGRTFLGYPRLALQLEDLQRNYYSGPAGFRTSAHFDVADSVTGSDVSFSRAVLSADYYLGLFDRRPDYRHILHVGADLGWMDAFAGDDTPLFQRFYLGGPRSFPGFEYRRVGPHQRRTPVGGQGMLHGIVDYSVPLLWREFRALALFDWGDLEPAFSDISLGGFRTGAGAGLQVRLKILGQPLPATFYWVKALSGQRGDVEEVFAFTLGFGL
jgi:outer membrane protein insertion porin family